MPITSACPAAVAASSNAMVPSGREKSMITSAPANSAGVATIWPVPNDSPTAGLPTYSRPPTISISLACAAVWAIIWPIRPFAPDKAHEILVILCTSFSYDCPNACLTHPSKGDASFAKDKLKLCCRRGLKTHHRTSFSRGHTSF